MAAKFSRKACLLSSLSGNAIDRDGAGGGDVEAGDGFKESGLAGAVSADEKEDLAAMYFEETGLMAKPAPPAGSLISEGEVREDDVLRPWLCRGASWAVGAGASVGSVAAEPA